MKKLSVIFLILMLLAGCARPDRLVIGPNSVQLKVGETEQMWIKVYDRKGREMTAEQVEKWDIVWNAAPNGVIAVDENGLVTALKEGITSLTAGWKDMGARGITVYVSK